MVLRYNASEKGRLWLINLGETLAKVVVDLSFVVLPVENGTILAPVEQDLHNLGNRFQPKELMKQPVALGRQQHNVRGVVSSPLALGTHTMVPCQRPRNPLLLPRLDVVLTGLAHSLLLSSSHNTRSNADTGDRQKPRGGSRRSPLPPYA